MTICEHPPPPVRRRRRRQPTAPSDLFGDALQKYPSTPGESTPDRSAQLLILASDPGASPDNREAAAHDLTLEYPRIPNP
jgi:hypothetical protein